MINTNAPPEQFMGYFKKSGFCATLFFVFKGDEKYERKGFAEENHKRRRKK